MTASTLRRARRFIVLPALLGLLLGGWACRRPAGSTANAPRIVRDGLGRSIRLPPAARIRRVISLAPSSTEILYRLGAGPLLVGVDRFSDYPPAVASVDKVGADLDPSLERMLALRPDLVFTATSANAQKTVEALERAGIPVYVSAPRRLDEILADVTGIAEALGRRDEGERVGRGLAARLSAVRARVAGEPPVRALAVVWADPLVVAGRDTHVDDLLRAAGARNAAGEVTGYPTYSVERVIVSAPEVIVIGSHSKSAAAAPPPPAIARLATVPAVRDRRLHGVDGDLLFRPGPRVVDAVERMADLFHPARPADPPRDH